MDLRFQPVLIFLSYLEVAEKKEEAKKKKISFLLPFVEDALLNVHPSFYFYFPLSIVLAESSRE